MKYLWIVVCLVVVTFIGLWIFIFSSDNVLNRFTTSIFSGTLFSRQRGSSDQPLLPASGKNTSRTERSFVGLLEDTDEKKTYLYGTVDRIDTIKDELILRYELPELMKQEVKSKYQLNERYAGMTVIVLLTQNTFFVDPRRGGEASPRDEVFADSRTLNFFVHTYVAIEVKKVGDRYQAVTISRAAIPIQ